MVKSIGALHDELSRVDELKNKLSFNGNLLRITFHQDYKVEINFKGGYYDLYINSFFDYSIEDQDILDFIIELARDMYVVQSKRFCKKIFTLVLSESFDKSKWSEKPDIKVLSPSGIILDNF